MTMDATRPAGDPVQIDHPRIPARVPPRRRPSGEPPPLPHHLGRTGKFWLIMVAYFVVTAGGAEAEGASADDAGQSSANRG